MFCLYDFFRNLKLLPDLIILIRDETSVPSAVGVQLVKWLNQRITFMSVNQKKFGMQVQYEKPAMSTHARARVRLCKLHSNIHVYACTPVSLRIVLLAAVVKSSLLWYQ